MVKLFLTKEEAEFVKAFLIAEDENDEIKEERKDELQAYLGHKKGEEVHSKIYETIQSVIGKLHNICDLDTTFGYDMALAKVVESNIFDYIEEE